MMSAHKIQLEIPDNLYQKLQHFAQLVGRPVENLMLQTLATNMPPLLEDLPAAMQPELLSLEQLDDANLWKTARDTANDKQQSRYNSLLNKQRSSSLNENEQEELEKLFQENEQRMLRKSYAYALLKLRGHRLPPLDQLPALPQ